MVSTDGSTTFAALIRSIPTLDPSCQLEGPVPEARPLSLAIWESPGDITTLLPVTTASGAAPEDIVVHEDLEGSIAVALSPEGLVVTTDRQAFRISLDGELQDLLANLAVPDDQGRSVGVPSVDILDDGTTSIADLRDGRLALFEVAQGEGSAQPTTRPVLNQTGYGEIRFSDDRIIVTRAADGDQVLVLNDE